MKLKAFLYDVGSIIKKEYWEIKRGIKNWVLCFLTVLIIPVIPKLYSERALFPLENILILIPIFVSMGISGQFAMYIILGEKKSKTLEYLISTRINYSAIILGKALFPTLLGYVLSLLSIICLKIVNPNLYPIYKESLNMFYFISLFFISFIIVLITIFIQIYFNDEKITPLLSFIVFCLILLLLWFLHFKLCIPSYIIIFIYIVISILFTWFCIISLSNFNFK